MVADLAPISSAFPSAHSLSPRSFFLFIDCITHTSSPTLIWINSNIHMLNINELISTYLNKKVMSIFYDNLYSLGIISFTFKMGETWGYFPRSRTPREFQHRHFNSFNLRLKCTLAVRTLDESELRIHAARVPLFLIYMHRNLHRDCLASQSDTY